MFAASFAVYTLGIVIIGILSARRAARSDADFFLAGRSLGPWVAALSASASSESGWVTIGLVGWAFRSGFSAYWIIPGCLLGFLFNWLFVAGRLRTASEQLGALTLPDFFAFRFRERVPVLRILSVIVILVAMLLYVAAQFAAAGKAFEVSFTGVHYRWGVIIGAAIVLVYTVLGGFRAACWTDLVQGLIMVGTLVLFPAYMLLAHGGYTFVEAQMQAQEGYLDFLPPFDTTSALIGFLLGSSAFGINFGYPGQPHVLVRFMALRDPKEARMGAVISSTWAVLVLWGAVTVGLMVRAMTASGAPWAAPLSTGLAEGATDVGDTGLVLAANHMMPGILSGMVLAAVLAAICSTADSQLVVAASSAANDIYVRLIERAGRVAHLLINRVIIFGLGVGAVLLVIDQEIEVYKYVLTYGWAILGASFGPQMILALMWSRATWAGCVAGMLTGFVVALGWQLAGIEVGFELYNLTLAFTAALLVNVVVSLISGASQLRAPASE